MALRSSRGIAADWSTLPAALSRALRGSHVIAGEVTAWSRAWLLEWEGEPYALTVWVHRSSTQVTSLVNLGDPTPMRLGDESREPQGSPEVTARWHNVMLSVSMPDADRTLASVDPKRRVAVRSIAAATIDFLCAWVTEDLGARLPRLTTQTQRLTLQLGATATLGWAAGEASVELRVPTCVRVLRQGKSEVTVRAEHIGRMPLSLQAFDPRTQLTSDFITVELWVCADAASEPLPVPSRQLGPGRLELAARPACIRGDSAGPETTLLFALDAGADGLVLVGMTGPRHSNAPPSLVFRPRTVLASGGGVVRSLSATEFHLVLDLHGALKGELVMAGRDWTLVPSAEPGDLDRAISRAGFALV